MASRKECTSSDCESGFRTSELAAIGSRGGGGGKEDILKQSNPNQLRESMLNASSRSYRRIAIATAVVIVLVAGVLVFYYTVVGNNRKSKDNKGGYVDDNDDDDSNYPLPASSTSISLSNTVLPPNYYSTGVRQDVGGNVVVTGGTGPPFEYEIKYNYSNITAYIYYGPQSLLTVGDDGDDDGNGDSTEGVIYIFHPHFPDSEVISSYLYGPNTALFNPTIGQGNITAVGSYMERGKPWQQSYIYQGPYDGSGSFEKIIVPDSFDQLEAGPRPGAGDNDAADDDFYNYNDGIRTVGHTTAHSTMGVLAVGNYYYQEAGARGHGFLYDLNTKKITSVNHGQSSTLYGIWQQGGNQSSVHYVLAGGYMTDMRSQNAVATLQTYDHSTGIFGPLKTFPLVSEAPYFCTSHFESITAVSGGYFMAAQCNATAAYAFVPAKFDVLNGTTTFGEAVWGLLNNTIRGSSGECTSDTTFGFSIIGTVSTGSSADDMHSFIVNATML